MAAVSLSPQPFTFSAMSTIRRGPLSNIPNGANSPLRQPLAKPKRSYASAQREENYGQPPPSKRQMLEPGVRASVRSPVKQKPLVQRGATRAYVAERARQNQSQKLTDQEVEEVRKWHQMQRMRFPKLVFYFDSIPDDQRVRLAKQIANLGAVSSIHESVLSHAVC